MELLWPLFRAGGTAPSYLWPRGRTASLRRRPVSYEHKSKKQAMDRGSVQRRAASHTNKIYFRHNFLPPSVLCCDRLGHRGRVGAVVCRLIVQNHAPLHLYSCFPLSTFIKNSSLDRDAAIRVRRQNTQIQCSNVTTSFGGSPPSVGKHSGDFSVSVMAPRQCKTKDGIFSGGGGHS